MTPQQWLWVWEAKVGRKPTEHLSSDDVARYKAMLDDDEAKRRGNR